MRHRRGNRKNSTLSIMLMIAFLLAVLVGLAILMAPEREPAPPVSSMTYAERPETHDTPSLPLAPYRDREGIEVNESEEEADGGAPTVVTVEETEVARYVITGTVLDKNTQAPVAHAYVIASRIPTEAEAAAFKEKDARIVAEKDSAAFSDLIEEKQRLWADTSGQSNAKGRFKLAVVQEGDYQITVTSQAHLKEVVEKHFVGETQPAWTVSIELSAGATVSGRIYDGYDNQGVAGLTVNATLDSDYYQRHAQTDEEGRYKIGGLSPGTYSVIADIENTAYRVTKELPFKRTAISTPDEAVTGIDFKLDKGGVVWGYVTTPDNEPIGADVVLCTSESILSQALSAMVRQAPPLHDSSNAKDGYYELVGVPLNEQWRLYATADESAPQLADPFILTERKKEARVDIYMFPGSNVYGQVVNSDGEGVPDAQIMCIPGYAQLLAPMDAPQAVRETRSDEEGYFEIRELPAGNYQVMAHKQGFKIALRGEPLYSDGYHEIKNFRVVLDDIEAGRYAVFGTVKDDSGSALAGVRVVLSGLGTESLQGVDRDTTTDSSGAFHIEGVEIGKYVLRAEYEGYSPKTLGRVLLDEPNTIIMRAAATVRGKVLLKATNQAPPGGYTVGATLLESTEEGEDSDSLMAFIESSASGNSAQSFQDPQGRYELQIAAGTWQIEGRAAGLTPKRKTITIQPGDVIDNINFLLSEDGGTISGRVTVADGSSPQGTLVSLIEANSASQALSSLAVGGSGELPNMHVGEDGVFQFDRLPEGNYNVLAQHPAYPQAMSESITLETDGEASGIEVRLGPGGTLEGFVYRNGQPVTGTVVTLIAGGSPYTGTSDVEGYYEIQNIPAGEYQVFAGEVGAAITGNSIGGQGYPVIIEDGLTTRQNFGDTNGITIVVTVVGRRGFLAATLNPPGAPVFQGDVELSQLNGYRSYVYGDVIRFEDIPRGDWQLDVYAGTGLTSSTLNWVGTDLVQVTGEEPEMAVTVAAQ